MVQSPVRNFRPAEAPGLAWRHLVSRMRSSHALAVSVFANFGFKRTLEPCGSGVVAQKFPYEPRRKVWGKATTPALALLVLLILPPVIAQAQILEGGTVKGQYGDWQIVCKAPPPGAKNEICAIVQSVTAEDRNNVGLTVYFQRFSDGRRVLRVFAPMGVLLPPGLGLKIDDKDVGHAPFARCSNFVGCYAQVVVQDQLLEQLKNGKTAVFIIFQSEEAGIGIPISLAGFGQALNGLR